MEPLKLIALSLIAILFASCKASQPTGPPSGSSGPSVGEVMSTLNTTQSKCYALAQANPGSSPQQIIMLTAAWLQTQSNVQSVEVYDSLTIDFLLKSGLDAVFEIYLADANGLALTRGGGPKMKPLRFGPSVPAAHALTNKNVLIYLPCENNADGAMRSNVITSLYEEGEIDSLINIFKKANQGFNVTVLYGDTLSEINTFGNYGIVFIDTHGLPSGFVTGAIVHAPNFGTDSLSEGEIKAQMDGSQAGPGTYEGIKNGSLRIQCSSVWEDFLKLGGGSAQNVLVTSKYIAALPPMPNTIIVGNFCYSGWASYDTTKNPSRVALNPIYPAFTSLHPLAYYSYAYPNGLSGLLDNTFGKRMEDSLAQALVVYGDSTGEAYKMADGFQYTARRLNVGNYSLDMPFNHYGPDNYSYPPDSMLDTRDGQVYKIVTIGTQTWMAQNLNFDAPGSECYDNDPKNCALFGKLYPWNVAMDGAASDSSNPSHVQGVCPKGWHIPSLSEWNQLIVAAGASGGLGGSNSDASRALRSTSTDTTAGGWGAFTTGISKATNSTGFSALPGGAFGWQNTPLPSGPLARVYGLKSISGRFLSSTLVPEGQPWAGFVNGIEIAGDVIPVYRFFGDKDQSDPEQPPMNASCRCVKDP